MEDVNDDNVDNDTNNHMNNMGKIKPFMKYWNFSHCSGK